MQLDDEGEERFAGPRGIAVDAAGNWLVCTERDHCVQIFSADGCFITAFGEPAVSESDHDVVLDSAHSICVDDDGRVLVGSRCCVKVFGFCW